METEKLDNVVSLDNHKKKKAYAKYIDDIENMLYVINLAGAGLSFYDKYSPVQDILMSLKSNKILLETYLKKYRDKL